MPSELELGLSFPALSLVSFGLSHDRIFYIFRSGLPLPSSMEYCIASVSLLWSVSVSPSTTVAVASNDQAEYWASFSC